MPVFSLTRRLNRVRPPRVHITYDVETGGAIEKRELPFVVGVLADFLGHRDDIEPLKDRAFLDIDQDNFDSVMAKICPELEFETPDRLTAEPKMLPVKLRLGKMAAFEPAELVSQIPPLAQMFEFRRRLSALNQRIATETRFEEEQEKAFRSGNLDAIGYLLAQTNMQAAAIVKEALEAHGFAVGSIDRELRSTIADC